MAKFELDYVAIFESVTRKSSWAGFPRADNIIVPDFISWLKNNVLMLAIMEQEFDIYRYYL